jgi:hypothetical protein
MIRSILSAFVFLIALAGNASAQNCTTYPTNLTNGTNADATQVMGNFNYVLGCVRDKLVAPRTYFVRTDGNDSNTGLVNSAGGAFLTIQKAINTVATLDINANTTTIQIADGTYTAANVLNNVVGFAIPGNLVIQGNNSTPANVVISTTSANAFKADSIAAVWDIKDLKIATTTSGDGIAVINGATVRFRNLNFGPVASSHLRADNAARLIALSSYTVSGNASFHWFAVNGGEVFVNNGLTITITGTPAIGTWTFSSVLAIVNCYSLTFSGAATGVRYGVNANGVVFTNGGSATYLPGNSAGSAASGGQYL